jgi:hypothetical protein
MIRGFTVLFLWHGICLWPIYLFVIISPISFELTDRHKRKNLLQALIIAALLILVPTTYLIAAKAGRALAVDNKGDSSQLPYVTFSTKTEKLAGQLLLFRSGMIFVHHAAITVPQGPSDNINLHLYRMEEITDLEVAEPTQ